MNQETKALLDAYDIDGTRISQTSTTRRLSDHVILSGQSVRYNVDMLNPTGYSQVLEEFVSNYTPDDASDPSQGGSWSAYDLYRSYLIGLQALGQSFAPGYESPTGIEYAGPDGTTLHVSGLTYNWLDGRGSGGNVSSLLGSDGMMLPISPMLEDSFNQPKFATAISSPDTTELPPRVDPPVSSEVSSLPDVARRRLADSARSLR